MSISDKAVLDMEDEAGSGPAGDKVEIATATPGRDVRRERRDPSARRRFLVVEAVSLVVIVGLAVALAVSQVQLSDQSSLNADRTSAVAAAKAYSSDVATYSYLHLRRDFGRVESESTASFRRTFIQSSRSLRKVLVQYKAVATAKVLRVGVESISSSNAVVLLFVNQSVKNTAQGVSTDTNRIEVTLVRSGNRWLLQNLKLL